MTMSTWLDEEPQHFPIPIDEYGRGPVADDDAVEIVCWCGTPGCREYLG